MGLQVHKAHARGQDFLKMPISPAKQRKAGVFFPNRDCLTPLSLRHSRS
jgi:hypothetical protein